MLKSLQFNSFFFKFTFRNSEELPGASQLRGLFEKWVLNFFRFSWKWEEKVEIFLESKAEKVAKFSLPSGCEEIRRIKKLFVQITDVIITVDLVIIVTLVWII